MAPQRFVGWKWSLYDHFHRENGFWEIGAKLRPMTDEGGDPACWLHRVCDDCGAVIEDDDHRCRGEDETPAN